MCVYNLFPEEAWFGQGIRKVVGEAGSRQPSVRENRVKGYKLWCVMTNEYFQVLPRHARTSLGVAEGYP